MFNSAAKVYLLVPLDFLRHITNTNKAVPYISSRVCHIAIFLNIYVCVINNIRNCFFLLPNMKKKIYKRKRNSLIKYL